MKIFDYKFAVLFLICILSIINYYVFGFEDTIRFLLSILVALKIIELGGELK